MCKAYIVVPYAHVLDYHNCVSYDIHGTFLPNLLPGRDLIYFTVWAIRYRARNNLLRCLPPLVYLKECRDIVRRILEIYDGQLDGFIYGWPRILTHPLSNIKNTLWYCLVDGADSYLWYKRNALLRCENIPTNDAGLQTGQPALQMGWLIFESVTS